MDLSFAALEPGIKAQLVAAEILNPVTAKKIAATLLPHKERFQAVESATGVPALWSMSVFHRENPSFTSYLGNGDPINEKTEHVPAGRGPFSTWEAGAIDALHLNHLDQIENWSWVRIVYTWESWNGFGVRKYHGRPSGYIWSGTNIYQGGKYIHDGPDGWSPGTWDKQIGCFAIAKALVIEDKSLEEGMASPAIV